MQSSSSRLKIHHRASPPQLSHLLDQDSTLFRPRRKPLLSSLLANSSTCSINLLSLSLKPNVGSTSRYSLLSMEMTYRTTALFTSQHDEKPPPATYCNSIKSIIHLHLYLLSHRIELRGSTIPSTDRERVNTLLQLVNCQNVTRHNKTT